MGVTVFIVEDSLLLRERLVALVAEVENAEVIGEADNAADAISGILSGRPDAAIVDIKLRKGSGIDVVRKLAEEAVETKVVVLTNNSSPDFKQRCLALGADHFLDKTNEFEKVKDVLEGLKSSEVQR